MFNTNSGEHGFDISVGVWNEWHGRSRLAVVMKIIWNAMDNRRHVTCSYLPLQTTSMKKTGVLLLNLGTPSHCDTRAVRRYLREFLSDPRVIDLPALLRWLLLNAVILPVRPKKTAKAYQAIWSATEGSPLLQHSQALQAALSARLGDGYVVALGMRYGQPSIEAAFNDLKACQRLIILPLFPQYSSAATGSAVEKTLSCLSRHWNVPDIIVQRDFYAEPGFIKAYADLIQRSLSHQKIERLIFSYHGLPERHIRKSGCQAVCAATDCPPITEKNQSCYRAQCYATSHAIAQAMGLPADQYIVCFQSRLGRTPWIKPYTDEVLTALVQKNIRHIAVVCPSFVADCLETLEEIGMRGKAQWEGLGGKTFIAVPCLNAEIAWVDALVAWVLQL
jgi:ferrochelatase